MSNDEVLLTPRSFGIYAIWFRPAGAVAGTEVPTVTRLPDVVPLLDAHFKARR